MVEKKEFKEPTRLRIFWDYMETLADIFWAIMEKIMGLAVLAAMAAGAIWFALAVIG